MGHWLLFQQPRYLSEPRRAGEQGVEVGSAPSVKRRVREAERARHRIFLSFPHTFQIGRAGTNRVPRRHRTPGRRAKEWQPPAVPSLDLIQRNSAGPIVLSRRAPSPLSVLHRNPIASCSDLSLVPGWVHLGSHFRFHPSDSGLVGLRSPSLRCFFGAVSPQCCVYSVVSVSEIC